MANSPYLSLRLILWAALLLALAACRAPTPPPSPTPWPTTPLASQTPANRTPPPTLIEITPSRPLGPTLTPTLNQIAIWVDLPPAQRQKLAEEVAAFQETYPQYGVTLHSYAGPEALLGRVDADAEIDVVLASPMLLNQLWAAEQLAPISDFLPAASIDEFAAATLSGARRDNTVWGLPDTAGFHLLLFYNQDLVESIPTDIDALAETAQALNQAGHQALAVNSYDPLWVLPWLTPYGGRLTNAAGDPTLNSPAMIAALTLFQSWHQPPAAIAPLLTYEAARAEFLAGDVAMMIDGDWALETLPQTGNLAWEVAPLPSLGQAEENRPAAPLILARYWAVRRAPQGDRALAVADFLEYITRPERQLAWTHTFGQLPTRREALKAPAIVNDPRLRLSAMQMQAGQPPPFGLDPNRLLDAMRQPLREMIDGGLTPTQAAQAMQANLTKEN
jgi:ABC-type glycerol-3-phosphate transport system substrate-binding protein